MNLLLTSGKSARSAAPSQKRIEDEAAVVLMARSPATAIDGSRKFGTRRPIGKTPMPFEVIEKAAVVLVARAVEVARYSELFILRSVQRLLAALSSESTNCGAVDDPTINCPRLDVVVPIN